MTIHTSYTEARANLASLMHKVVADQETVVIARRGAQPVALIDAGELASLQETAHLLRSPNNAARLLTALSRALRGSGPAETIDHLRQDLGLDAKG